MTTVATRGDHCKILGAESRNISMMKRITKSTGKSTQVMRRGGTDTREREVTAADHLGRGSQWILGGEGTVLTTRSWKRSPCLLTTSTPVAMSPSVET